MKPKIFPVTSNTCVLINRAAGFLGSNLCCALFSQNNQNNQVVGLDNFCSGKIDDVATLVGQPAFEMVRHDVRDAFGGRFDLIFHLACPASPPIYQRDPIATAETCVLGALNMLRLAKETGARIVLTSTSEGYGDREQHPQTERYRGRVVRVPLPVDDPRQRRPDISLARAKLGWTPSVKLRDGLAQTIAHFEGVLGPAHAEAAQ